MIFKLSFPYNWKYPLRTWWPNICWIPYLVKCFFQRGANGYSVSDVIGMDSYLNEIIISMLKEIRDVEGKGHPVFFTGKKWNETLNKMIIGFEANQKLSGLDYNWKDKKEELKLRRQWKIGSELFIKYFNHLWL